MIEYIYIYICVSEFLRTKKNCARAGPAPLILWESLWDTVIHTSYHLMVLPMPDDAGVTGSWEVRRRFKGTLHFDCSIHLG